MDEPSASLTEHETQRLLALARRLREQGVAILYVSHRMNEVFALSVRNGRTIVLRGRIPNNLLNTLSSVASRAKLKRATIRAVKGPRHARLVFRGVSCPFRKLYERA